MLFNPRGIRELEPAILENKSRLDQCDVICYAYDSSDPKVSNILLNYEKTWTFIG